MTAGHPGICTTSIRGRLVARDQCQSMMECHADGSKFTEHSFPAIPVVFIHRGICVAFGCQVSIASVSSTRASRGSRGATGSDF